MSKTTKRKHVTREALDDYYVPEGKEEIVKIVGGKGNNLHEVECADGKKFLVSMPTKFRKNLWIKRGDFVVIDPIKEGNKVLAEIVYVLYDKQIKYLKAEGLWPDAFTDNSKLQKAEENQTHLNKRDSNCSSSSEDDDDDLFRNPNRREFVHAEDSSSDSSDEDEDDDGVSEGQKTAEVNNLELEKEIYNKLKIK